MPGDPFLPCLNLFTLWALPPFSTGPALGAPDMLPRVKAAGFDAIQGLSAEGAHELGMTAFGVARIETPGMADMIARARHDAGFAATTVIVGTGLETDIEIDQLCDALIEAGVRHGHPLLLETHRGSITQDLRRTIDMIGRFPDLRFTADLSHWYVGHDLATGDFEAKLAFLAPLFARVRLVQGRIGTPTAMQMAVDGPDDDRPWVLHYRRMWRECFAGFLAHAAPGDRIAFAPELLPSVAPFEGQIQYLYFAQTRRLPDGKEVEMTDRWQQAIHLLAIARGAFAEAQRLSS